MKHFALLGACLAAIGTMGSASHDWSEILSPKFVCGALVQVGLTIASMYTERPNEKQQRRAKVFPLPDPHRPGFRPSGKTVR